VQLSPESDEWKETEIRPEPEPEPEPESGGILISPGVGFGQAPLDGYTISGGPYHGEQAVIVLSVDSTGYPETRLPASVISTNSSNLENRDIVLYLEVDPSYADLYNLYIKLDAAQGASSTQHADKILNVVYFNIAQGSTHLENSDLSSSEPPYSSTPPNMSFEDWGYNLTQAERLSLFQTWGTNPQWESLQVAFNYNTRLASYNGPYTNGYFLLQWSGGASGTKIIVTTTPRYIATFRYNQ